MSKNLEKFVTLSADLQFTVVDPTADETNLLVQAHGLSDNQSVVAYIKVNKALGTVSGVEMPVDAVIIEEQKYTNVLLSLLKVASPNLDKAVLEYIDYYFSNRKENEKDTVIF